MEAVCSLPASLTLPFRDRNTHRAAEEGGFLDLSFTRSGFLTTDLVKLEKQVVLVHQFGWQFNLHFFIKLWLSTKQSNDKMLTGSILRHQQTSIVCMHDIYNTCCGRLRDTMLHGDTMVSKTCHRWLDKHLPSPHRT